MSTTSSSDDNDLEEVEPHRNAFFKDRAREFFPSAFRGIPAPARGGVQTVTEDDVHGSLTHCWCGQVYGHDWPGKRGGAPHPKAGAMPEITRRDLRAYHSTLQTFILQAVNTHGLNYKLKANGLLLFPPDGSRAVTINARNSETQVRSLVKWWEEHMPHLQEPEVKEESKEVTPQAVERLAAHVNSPEHPVETKPVKKAAAKPAPPAKKAVKKAAPKVEPVAEPAKPEEPAEWVPYHASRDGHEVENIETNGTTFRCHACLGTDHEWSSDNPKGISGHIRTRHRPTDNLWGKEATQKKTKTRGVGVRLTRQVKKVIEELAEAIDYDITTDDALLKENALLKRQVEEAIAATKKAEARADEAETRLALIRESLAV